jgi:hypothetical protein
MATSFVGAGGSGQKREQQQPLTGQASALPAVNGDCLLTFGDNVTLRGTLLLDNDDVH